VRRSRVAAALVVLALLVGVGAVVIHRAGTDRSGASSPGAVAVGRGEADFSYVIPRGTGGRLDRGERVEILPARIAARVGDVIRIENRDARGYLLGPFYVGPGETVAQRFVSPGRFTGECAVHPSGQIVLDVSA
jgi:hypothetical protein